MKLTPRMTATWGRRRLLRLGLFLFLTLTAVGKQKLDKDLEKVDPNATVDVILQFTAAPTDQHFQKVKDLGGKQKHHLKVVNSAAFSLSAHVLRSLAEDPEVEQIVPDRQVRNTAQSAAPIPRLARPSPGNPARPVPVSGSR